MARLTDVLQGCGAAPQHQQSLARNARGKGWLFSRAVHLGIVRKALPVRWRWCTTMPRFIMVDGERSSINSKDDGLPRFF